MREILFRGKREDTGEWVYGYYAHLPSAAGAADIIYVPASDPDDSNHTVFVDPETLGQYTGLTDKNGVKIFEGDIVHLYGDKDTSTRFINYKALVIFAHGGFCAIDGTLDDYAVCRFDFTSSLNCEVIGNIYDNPELIEDGDSNEEP